MSGFGLGGFGSGFLQGFETMGQDFARRGIVQDAARSQARQDRQLAMEEELNRIKLEREAKESDARVSNLGANTRQTNVQTDLMPAESGAKTNNLIANTRQTNVQTDLLPAESAAKTNNLNASANQTNVQTGLLPAESAAKVGAENARKGLIEQQTTTAGLDNQGKTLELSKQQTAYEQQRRLSDVFHNISEGKATPDELKFALPQLKTIYDLSSNPNLANDVNTVVGAVHEAAQTGKDVEAFNTPPVMEAINRTIGPQVNSTRGMPLDPSGRQVVRGTELLRMVRHPGDNKIGFEVMVQPGPSPQRATEIETALKTASPQEAEALQAELNPPAYRAMLTNDRVPVAQGGEPRWFGPDELQKAIYGLGKVVELHQNNPDFAVKMADLMQKIDRGELTGQQGATLSDQLKVRESDRNDEELRLKKEQFGLQKQEATQKAEAQRQEMQQKRENAAYQQWKTDHERWEAERTVEQKRREEKQNRKKFENESRNDKIKEANGIIDKVFGPETDMLSGTAGFKDDTAAKNAAYKVKVDEILRRHPHMTGAQAYARADEELKGGGVATVRQPSAAPLAAGGVRPGAPMAGPSSPKAQQLKSLWGDGG